MLGSKEKSIYLTNRIGELQISGWFMDFQAAKFPTAKEPSLGHDLSQPDQILGHTYHLSIPGILITIHLQTMWEYPLTSESNGKTTTERDSLNTG